MKINPKLALVDYFDVVEKIFDRGCRNADSIEHVILWSEKQVPLVSKRVDWDHLNLVEYSWMESTVKLENDSISDLEFQLEALESLGFLEKISKGVFQIKNSFREAANEMLDRHMHNPIPRPKDPSVNQLVSS